jgi:hypothetical protein
MHRSLDPSGCACLCDLGVISASFAVKIFKAYNRKDRKGSQSSRRNSALKKPNPLSPEMGKEAQEWLGNKLASRISCPPFPGRELAPGGRDI